MRTKTVTDLFSQPGKRVRSRFEFIPMGATIGGSPEVNIDQILEGYIKIPELWYEVQSYI